MLLFDDVTGANLGLGLEVARALVQTVGAEFRPDVVRAAVGARVKRGWLVSARALADMRAVVRVWRPLLAQWRREYEELDLEDQVGVRGELGGGPLGPLGALF